MLKVMRESFHHLKWTLWGVVFVFIAFIFVDWGMGGRSGTRFNSGEVARVGGESISAVDFNRQYQMTVERYRQMYKEHWNPSVIKNLNLPSQVLNSMVERQLMVDAAQRAGIQVSDAELAEKIRAMSAFKNGGGEFVGSAAYAGILASNGYTVEQFEHDFRQDLMLEKFNRLIAESLVITDAAVEAQFARQNEKAKVEWILLTSDKFGAAPEPTEAELLAFFNANRERFRQPERRKLKYLLVETARLREAAKPSDSEIAAYYQAHASEFQAGERVHAAHILIKADANAPPAVDAAAKKKAEAILARAQKGGDFAALARAESEDTGSKANGGDLGSFTRGKMVKPFEEAVFAMAPGEIRGPVKTPYGYHVVKLLEKIPPGPQTLAEAAPRIVNVLSQEKLKTAERKKVELLEKAVRKKSSDDDLRKLAGDAVSFNATEWVTAKDVIPGLGYSPELLKAAFELKKGEVTVKAIQTPGGSVFARVADVRSPGLPDFAEVKSKILAEVKSEKLREQMLQGAKPIAAELAAGTSLSDVASRYGVQVNTSSEFIRQAAVPGLATSEELGDAIFKTAVGATGPPIAIGQRGVALFKVDSRTDFDAAAFAAQKEHIRESLRQQQAQKLIQADIARRREEARVVINEEALERFSQG
jgi:peptidyl-prolyl cis-trans isomerase D